MPPSSLVLQPMKTHVDAFRQARRDRPIGQAHGDLVIAKEECGGLRVAQVVQDGALDVCETGQRNQFRVQHVAGHDNIADFFTKALPRDKCSYNGQMLDSEYC